MTGGNLQQWTNGTSRLLQMPMVGSATLTPESIVTTMCMTPWDANPPLPSNNVAHSVVLFRSANLLC